MILAGVLLKMGGYGILRIAYPICPWAAEQLAFWVALFGIINIVYGAFAAMAQTDFKKLVAYSSISHMGYVILGIAVWAAPSQSQYWAWGMNGAMFQMIAHGITSAGMFFLVGVIYDRAHHRNLDNFRGLYEPMPLYGGISAIIFFAAMGLPGMCGFVGEFMVILATWNFHPAEFPAAGQVMAVLAALTVVLTAAYILWTLQRVYLAVNPAYKDYQDMDLREVLIAIPLVILSVALGVLPGWFLLSWMQPSLDVFVNSLAMRVRVRPATSVAQLIAEVRATTLEADRHQDVPFERLVQELAPQRDLATTPIFQVVLAMQNMPHALPRLAGLDAQRVRSDERHGPYDLQLFVYEERDGVELSFVYKSSLFEHASMGRHDPTGFADWSAVAG